MATVRPPKDTQRYNWASARLNCHRHQRLTSRVVRTLRATLGLTQEQFSRQMGVTPVVISRWERTNGSHPSSKYWVRLKELWWLGKWSKTEQFLRDRDEPADFSQ